MLLTGNITYLAKLKNYDESIKMGRRAGCVVIGLRAYTGCIYRKYLLFQPMFSGIFSSDITSHKKLISSISDSLYQKNDDFQTQ